MKLVDRLTTEKYGLPSLLLMENAGISLYLALRGYFGEDLSKQRTAIICGKGNNGGDGLVLARQLRQREIAPDVFLLAPPEKVSGDARINLDIYQAMGGQLQPVLTEEDWSRLTPCLESYDLVVDAILGTGISKPVAGLHAQVVEDVNRLRAFVLSVDFPSGMASDAFRGEGPTIRADATVTFTAPKIAHVLHEDQESLGSLHLFPIGTPPELLQTPDYPIELITQPLASTCLPQRRASFHKGSFGHTVIVAGSRGKSGAAALATSAALRSGSGLVTACIPEGIRGLVGSFRPEVMTEGLASTEAGTFASECWQRPSGIPGRQTGRRHRSGTIHQQGHCGFRSPGGSAGPNPSRGGRRCTELLPRTAARALQQPPPAFGSHASSWRVLQAHREADGGDSRRQDRAGPTICSGSATVAGAEGVSHPDCPA